MRGSRARNPLGHGDSAKPRSGEYSLGAHAAGLRDLLAILDLERATVVGHSFGRDVALQFAYQYPELTERVVLVASVGRWETTPPWTRPRCRPPWCRPRTS